MEVTGLYCDLSASSPHCQKMRLACMLCFFCIATNAHRTSASGFFRNRPPCMRMKTRSQLATATFSLPAVVRSARSSVDSMIKLSTTLRYVVGTAGKATCDPCMTQESGRMSPKSCCIVAVRITKRMVVALLVVAGSVLCCIFCVRHLPIIRQHTYWVSSWWLADKLDPRYSHISLAAIWLLPSVSARPQIIEAAKAFDELRASPPEYTSGVLDLYELGIFTGVPTLARAIFGYAIDERDYDCIAKCSGAYRLIDDYYDQREDQECSKPNYYNDHPQPQPLEFAIRLKNKYLSEISNEQLLRWMRHWDCLYFLERNLFKRHLKKEVEQAERRAAMLKMIA